MNNQNNLKGENKFGELILLAFKFYCKDAINEKKCSTSIR
jgi:hypothetical protein